MASTKIRSCANCEKTDIFQDKFLLCGACKNAYYCNQQCQRANWPSHKILCEKPQVGLKKLLEMKRIIVNNKHIIKFLCEVYDKFDAQVIMINIPEGDFETIINNPLSIIMNSKYIFPYKQVPEEFSKFISLNVFDTDNYIYLVIESCKGEISSNIPILVPRIPIDGWDCASIAANNNKEAITMLKNLNIYLSKEMKQQLISFGDDLSNIRVQVVTKRPNTDKIVNLTLSFQFL